mgnify:CR=1 FL=1
MKNGHRHRVAGDLRPRRERRATSRVLGFLQPILIPFAVAGVLAYLLDPVVDRLERLGLSRLVATIVVMLLVTLLFVLEMQRDFLALKLV